LNAAVQEHIRLYTLGVMNIAPRLNVLSNPSTLSSGRLKQNNFTSCNCLLVYRITLGTLSHVMRTQRTNSSVCTLFIICCTSSPKLWNAVLPLATFCTRSMAAFLFLTTRVACSFISFDMRSLDFLQLELDGDRQFSFEDCDICVL